MMYLVDILNGVNYGLVFFFGAALSVSVAGGCRDKREWILLFTLCPLFLALQTVSWLTLGLAITKQLYPLFIHLPLLAVLVFGMKRPVAMSLVSICTGYLCCQLPRCGDIAVTAATGSPLVGQIVYTIILAPIFLFLLRYFVPAARGAMTESPRSLFLFGGLPVIYYVFDYTTAVYSDLLYSGSKVLAQMIPTVVGLFYMVYTTAYRQQLQQRSQTQMQSSLLSTQLKQAEKELAALRRSESQSVLYRHDMRHHLTAINAFLTKGRFQQAQEYISEVQSGIEAITPKRFCDNELVNLLCSAFSDRAERLDVRLTVRADLPTTLSIPDIELCALLSNGLENALAATGTLDENRRWISCSCSIRASKLLIEIKNPCVGKIAMRDGLPVSEREGHGYGCRSIQTITQTCHGLCEFTAEDGIFTLRAAMPVQDGRPERFPKGKALKS